MFLEITIESFLIDGKAAGLSPHTLKLYQQFHKPFITHCDANALQRLTGHADLQIMRRCLAQNNTDTQAAHMRGSPVDNGL